MKKLVKRLARLKLNTKITIVILVFTFLPIAVFSGVLFYNLEQDVIKDSKNYMLYKMNRESDQIATDVDSINMSTRFFLTHEGLQGKKFSFASTVSFRSIRLLKSSPFWNCL